MRGAWNSAGIKAGLDYEKLPVDLTPGGIEGRPACWRAAGRPLAGFGGIWKSWLCTRPVGHTGRHAAGDGLRIRAVWP